VVILIIPAVETSWYRVGGQYSTSKTADTAGADQSLRGCVGVEICCEGGACLWVCGCGWGGVVREVCVCVYVWDVCCEVCVCVGVFVCERESV